jgi:hypothetical protein
MITPEQSAQLKDYFPVKSHEFLNGNTYITEEAITNRLDEVDPSWQFKKLDIHRDGTTVTAVYCMVVCGVERDGVGMASVQYGKDKSGNPTDREVNEAEKSAATDALKRCARLFGIGRYILEMGKAVTDYRTLEQWLIQRRGVDTSTGEMSQSNVTPLNSRQEGRTADLPVAAGEYTPAPQNGARTPKQALNGNGAPPPGQKKDSDTREWTASAVTVRKDRNGNPYLQYTCAEGKPTGRGRDMLRQAGYECEPWTVEGETYELIPPAIVTVEKNGNFWNVLALKTAVVSTETF